MTGRSPAQPLSLFVTLPGRLTHHFVEIGGGSPTLVFLHGFSDSWRSFEPLFSGLGQHFRLLALDQRGHGNSEAGKHYEVSEFSMDAIAFISAAAKEPVHLVGHSLGSIIAQRVAASRPDLVRSLVLIGAAQNAIGHAGALELQAELVGLGELFHAILSAHFRRAPPALKYLVRNSISSSRRA